MLGILSRLYSIEALKLLDEVRAAALVQCQAFGRGWKSDSMVQLSLTFEQGRLVKISLLTIATREPVRSRGH